MRTTVVLLLLVATLVALPAAAELYDVRLTNGTTFQSRYPPRQASWDPGVLTFLDETGVTVALPKSLVAQVSASSETKGFGRVLDRTTLDLGYMPNDLTAAQQQAQAAAAMANTGGFFNRSFDQRQFVDPSQAGGGIPVFGGGGGGVVTPNPAAPAEGMPVGTPPPFTTVPQTGTPAPFTTVPQTGTPAPFTTVPQTGTPAPFTTAPTVSSPSGMGASPGPSR